MLAASLLVPTLPASMLPHVSLQVGICCKTSSRMFRHEQYQLAFQEALGFGFRVAKGAIYAQESSVLWDDDMPDAVLDTRRSA